MFWILLKWYFIHTWNVVSTFVFPFTYFQTASSKSQKNSHQPSISITALPRQTQPNPSTNLLPSNALQQASILPKPPSAANVKPGQTQSGGGKASFVICEICDGWIKDLDQLRNHMQWMHKVKIHPKMIYNRPPLNCQKCQFRFFTDQGLERHLLGSHGLVTRWEIFENLYLLQIEIFSKFISS